jgi:hypothetical protein
LHPLDPIHEKPELEVQAKQARAEETDPEPEPDQGKPRCITPQSLIFIWITIFMLKLIVH